MCGRFTSLLSPELMEVIFQVKAPQVLAKRYNIAPTQMVPVVRCCENDHNQLEEMKWGLIPSWAKEPSIGSHMINARSETVHEKPAFRHAIKYRRCIVPASGFFEWSHAGDSKQPYYIRLLDNSPMGLAGILETCKTPSGDQLESFSILTTSTNSLVSQLHDRMPVILHSDEYALWLNRNMHEPEQLTHLYLPYPADLMTAIKVSPFVNSPAHDSPECINPLPK